MIVVLDSLSSRRKAILIAVAALTVMGSSSVCLASPEATSNGDSVVLVTRAEKAFTIGKKKEAQEAIRHLSGMERQCLANQLRVINSLSDPPRRLILSFAAKKNSFGSESIELPLLQDGKCAIHSPADIAALQDDRLEDVLLETVKKVEQGSVAAAEAPVPPTAICGTDASTQIAQKTETPAAQKSRPKGKAKARSKPKSAKASAAEGPLPLGEWIGNEVAARQKEDQDTARANALRKRDMESQRRDSDRITETTQELERQWRNSVDEAFEKQRKGMSSWSLRLLRATTIPY